MWFSHRNSVLIFIGTLCLFNLNPDDSWISITVVLNRRRWIRIRRQRRQHGWWLRRWRWWRWFRPTPATRIRYSAHVRTQKFRNTTDSPLASRFLQGTISSSTTFSFPPAILASPSPSTARSSLFSGPRSMRSLCLPSTAPPSILWAFLYLSMIDSSFVCSNYVCFVIKLGICYCWSEQIRRL